MPSRFAEVISGEVTRVFRVQTGGLIEDPSDQVSPGWLYNGSQFSTPPPPEPSVPAYVTKLGLMRACLQQEDWNSSGENLWTIAKAVIESLPSPQKDEWELATQIPRADSSFVDLAKSPAIGATDEQIDEIFLLARTLE